jgi:tetratricopeptide (TPR) repeat protein
MKVTALLTRAIAVGAAAAALTALIPGTTAYAADQKQQVSQKLAKPLHDAQEDLKNHKYSEAIAKLKEADASPDKKPYDQHVINDFLGFAYAKTNNFPEAAKAWGAELDDGFTSQADIATKTKEVAAFYYQAKNYDKAIEYGQRAIKGGFADDQTRVLVGQSYYLKGDWKGTLKYEDAMVDSQAKAGQTPSNESLMLIYSSCQKLQDEACATHAMERLVTYYPKPESWAQLLYAVRKETSANESDLMQTYRLMFDTDVLKEPADYTEMAELALDAGSPGEAQKVLERAFQRNVFTDQRSKDRAQRLLDSAKKRAVADQAGLPKLEQEANSATTGDKNVAVGRAYLGYGQYDKADDQLTKGLTKGSVKNEADARLTLGIAQLKAGHKDEAVKTFKSVKGDPALEKLANLWALHSKQAGASVANAQ